MAGLRHVSGGVVLALVAGACVRAPSQAPRTSPEGQVGPVPLIVVARHIFAVEEPQRRGFDTVVVTVNPLAKEAGVWCEWKEGVPVRHGYAGAWGVVQPDDQRIEQVRWFDRRGRSGPAELSGLPTIMPARIYRASVLCAEGERQAVLLAHARDGLSRFGRILVFEKKGGEWELSAVRDAWRS